MTKTAVVLVVCGVALVVAGFAFETRSWGWSYALVPFGLILGAVAVVSTSRHRRSVT